MPEINHQHAALPSRDGTKRDAKIDIASKQVCVGSATTRLMTEYSRSMITGNQQQRKGTETRHKFIINCAPIMTEVMMMTSEKDKCGGC